jgi:competence protein ComEC
MNEKININSASETDLQKIIHIGPVRALKIINHRPFRDIYELSNVLGLGKKRMDQILAQGLAIT